MKIEWFVYHKNTVLGPYNTSDIYSHLSSGKISDDSFIWWKGEKDWISLLQWKQEYPTIIKKLEEHFNVEWKIKDPKTTSPFMSFDDCIQYLKNTELNNTIFICQKGKENWENIFTNAIFMNALEMTRRKVPRVPIVATAKISKADSKFSYLVKVNIIGQGGIGVSGLGKNFPTGTNIDIKLESPSLTIPIHLEGRILYHTKDGSSGIEFEKIAAEPLSAIIEYINRFQETRSDAA